MEWEKTAGCRLLELEDGFGLVWKDLGHGKQPEVPHWRRRGEANAAGSWSRKEQCPKIKDMKMTEKQYYKIVVKIT